MNDSLDDLLHRYFDDVVRDDRLGDTPVRVVMRRGRRRRGRRRTAAMAGTLAVGAIGSAFAVRTLSGDDATNRSIQVGNDGTPDATTDGSGPLDPERQDGATDLVPSPLVWNSMTVGSAEALAGLDAMFGSPTGGAYYAISSEPGRSLTSNWDAVLYRSTDGVHWEAAGAPPALSSRSELVATAGRLYAVGTQAGSTAGAAPWETTLAVSADDGATWSKQPLPVDLDAIRALPTVGNLTARSAVAAAGGVTVIATTTRAAIDPQQVAPPGVRPDSLSLSPQWGGFVEYEMTDCADGALAPPDATTIAPAATTSPDDAVTATTVVDTVPPCGWSSATRAYSWAELGVPPEAAAAAQGQLHLAITTDGQTFTDVPAPALPEGWSLDGAGVWSIGDEVLLTANQARLADPLAMEDNGYEQRSVGFTSADGVTWVPIDLPVSSVERAGLLGNGSLAVLGTAGDSTVVAVRLADGSWHSTVVNDLLATTDANLMSFPVTNPAIGPMGVATLVQLQQPVTVPAADPNGTVPMTETTIAWTGGGSRLLFSPDGVTWSVEDLDALAPGAFGGRGVTIAGDRVIVDLTTAGTSTDPGAPLPDRQYLVGTLAG